MSNSANQAKTSIIPFALHASSCIQFGLMQELAHIGLQSRPPLAASSAGVLAAIDDVSMFSSELTRVALYDILHRRLRSTTVPIPV